MNLFSRIKAALRSFADPSPEVQRSFGAVKTRSGEDVNSRTAMSASAVFACVRNLAEDVSKLPLLLHRKLHPQGKETLVDDPLYHLLHDEPNPEMTSMVFRTAVTGCAMLGGNGWAEIERNGAGAAIALWPLEWWRVVPRRTDAGELYYLVDGKDRIPAADMLHIPGFSTTGILGAMIVQVGRESIGLALALEKYAASFFGNGAVPGGVLMHPGVLGEEGQKNLRQSWNDTHQGPDAAHQISILEEDMKYEKIGSEPEEAQMVQSRLFQVEEIARWFRMPPHKIGHLLRATFSNIEHQSIEYVQDTMMPWCVKWEQELKRKVIPRSARGVFAEHLVNGLLRGDAAARGAFYKTMREMGCYNADKILELENENPLPNGQGQTYLVPLNMVDAAKLTGAVPPAAPTPVAKEPGDADPGPGTIDVKPVPDDPPDPYLLDPTAFYSVRAGAIRAAHEPLLSDLFGRLIRLETDKRERSKADDGFWRKHRDHVAEVLQPAVRALAASLLAREPGDDLAAEVAAITQQHVSRSQKSENAPETMAALAAERIVAYAKRYQP